MTLVAVGGGLYYPHFVRDWLTNQTSPVMDAATEKFAMIGRLYIDGRPTSPKTLSTGNIQYRAGTVTFANAGTTIDIGIQDVASGAGPIAQPDGTFDVKTTLTGGGGGITTAAWNTATMTSGSKSMSHGDLIAIVWDMTARGGADSVIVFGGLPNFISTLSAQFPVTNAFVSSAWQTTAAAGAGRMPNAIITFDDGTLGWIDGSQVFSSANVVETYADATNPDERGTLFQVPWSCKVDAFCGVMGVTDANSDWTFKLWSAPTTSPSLLASVAVAAENLGVAASSGPVVIPLATEISLAANTDYAITALATGSSNVRLMSFTLGNAAHRVTIPGGTTLAKVTRNNSTGNFAAESPAITMYGIGVRISQVDDGTGSGSGLLRHPGMAGGLNG